MHSEKSRVADIGIVILLLSFLFFSVTFVHAQQTSSTIASLVINQIKQINITSFEIKPISVYQFNYADFTIRVENTGSVSLEVEPVLIVSSKNISFIKRNISPGSTAEFTTQLQMNFAPGEYTARAIVYYDNRSMIAEKNFTVLVQPPVSSIGEGAEEVYILPTFTPPPTEGEEIKPGAGKEEIPLPEIVAPEEKEIRFEKTPVLIETRPGETEIISFSFKPIIEKTEKVRISISGIPEKWITQTQSEVLISPEKEEGVNIAITTPLTAAPNDYKIIVKLSGDELNEENFFVLRVKPYPVKLAKPAVLRKVYVDKANEKTVVRIDIENSGETLSNVEIIEEVSKDIAERASMITFLTPAAEILREDPLLKFTIPELEPYEIFSVSYEVPKVSNVLTPYVYWPIRQISVIYAPSNPMDFVRISEISSTQISPGKEGRVYLTIMNLYRSAINITIIPEIPENFAISPEKVNFILKSGEAKNLVFSLSASEGIEEGAYTLTFRVSSESGEKVKTGIVNVESREARGINLKQIAKYLAYLIILVSSILAIRKTYKKVKRKRLHRKEKVAEIKELKEAMLGEK